MVSEDLRIDSVVTLPFYASAHAQPGQHLGPSLPRLGLGVYKNEDPKPAVLAALKHGYRHIDTARMYRNEQAVGQAVRESGVPRGQVFVTSKVDSKEHGSDVTPKAIEDSVQKLGLGHIDLLLIHSPLSGKEKRLEAWKAFIAARDKGQVHNIGVSNYGVKHLEEIREAGLETPSVNQLELHPFCQQKEIVEYCQKHGIVAEAYTPLIRGGWNDTIVDIGKKYNKDPAQVLVRWSLQRGFVPLPKSANPERVVSNAQVYDFELSTEDLKTLDSLDRGKEGSVTWNPVDAA
ncbi:Aldo/keto reductase [Dichomitus squalens]|uniref:Aldo/keto reductase n=1 Tax=Dichomitus squalens TaxID=114155 RepID=A0A4Q9NTI4_9APHY|nr:Aldo/keto reductase [Dichomitus squalens]TBU54418.1 Aldo/keto reductase [Dichomitus squalens]